MSSGRHSSRKRRSLQKRSVTHPLPAVADEGGEDDPCIAQMSVSCGELEWVRGELEE